MTDEQRPWDQELQRVAGDRWPTYLYSLDEAREICARVWREAQMESLRLRSTAPPREVDAQDTPLHRFMAHQNTRAAAAEAQRDRLAEAGQAVCDGVLKSMTGIPLMWLGEPALAVRPAVIDALRAALADVPEGLHTFDSADMMRRRPDDRARRRDEAYRAMVEALDGLDRLLRFSTPEPGSYTHELNTFYAACHSAGRALALARQVEEG